MNWQLNGEQFLLTGLEGVRVSLITRERGIPAGEKDPQQIRSLLAQSGIRPALVVAMEQVHGGVVRLVKEKEDILLPGCDGLVTDSPGTALTMRSADCLPVVAFDRRRRILGLAHAGWRGIRAGILAELVKTIGSSDLTIGIGPGIGPCCYAVGPEFKEGFSPELKARNSTLFLDLGKAAVRQLIEEGIRPQDITEAKRCTSCEADLFFSYRRGDSGGGRMLTVAMIDF